MSDAGSLLRHVDTAMYQAKDRGRNNFQIFNPVMDRKLTQRVAIEASLRTALESAQLDVYYQPVIEIETRRVAALEALVRGLSEDRSQLHSRPGHGLERPRHRRGHHRDGRAFADLRGTGAIRRGLLYSPPRTQLPSGQLVNFSRFSLQGHGPTAHLDIDSPASTGP